MRFQPCLVTIARTCEALSHKEFVLRNNTAWKTAYILGHLHKILQLLAVDEDGPFQTVIYVRAQHFVTIVNKFRIHQPKPFLRW